MNRKFVLMLAFVFVVAFAFSAQAADPMGEVTLRPGEPIHIAYWVVISGPNTSLGTDVVRGIELAMDDFGGQIKGFPLKLSGQDAGCSAEGGQAAATKLAADPTIVAAIGSTCSSAAKPGVPILWKAGIPTVSPSNTAPFLTDPNRGSGYDGYARTCHNDKIQGAVAAQFAFNEKGLKAAATIHDGSVYAEQLAQVFAATFKKLGGTVTSMEAVSPNDTDMRPVLTKIATGKPDIIYYPIFIAEGGFITRQSKEISGLEKTVLMGADGMFSPDFYKAAGMAAVGMFHSSPDFAAFAGGYQDFLKKHQAKYGEKPIAPFHGHAYDATMMILTSIDKVAVKKGDNLVIGRKALRDALLATSNMQGLTGKINCDQYGDCADPKIAVYQTSEENVKKLVTPTKPYWKIY
ncbi:MAG: branched-chain amino acid ABC transporter substrate-binding protein [Desulfobacterales bacterium]